MECWYVCIYTLLTLIFTALVLYVVTTIKSVSALDDVSTSTIVIVVAVLGGSLLVITVILSCCIWKHKKGALKLPLLHGWSISCRVCPIALAVACLKHPHCLIKVPTIFSN